MSILIINPNSSVSVTETLKEILDPAPDVTYSFFTAPPEGPLEINSHSTEVTSAAVCLEALKPVLGQHDAFLVACYSDHPLIYALREHTDKPVLGIFHASVLQAMALGVGKFAVVTTAKVWEHMLDEAVSAFLGSHKNYAGTFSSGLGVLELHDAPQDIVNDRLGQAATRAVNNGAKVLLMGCAGMSGMEEAIQSSVPSGIRVIDSVVAGCEILVGVLRTTNAIARD